MEPPPTEEEDLDHHPRLLLFSLPSLRWSPDPTRYDDPDPPGARTPPLHTHASVPFLWEAAPGKPKHNPSTLPQQPSQYPSPNPSPSPDPNPNSRVLDLPPRLAKFTKTPSPTTVLEGPYPSLLGRSILESSSFRGFLRSVRRRGGSFDGALSGGSSPDRGLLGPGVGLTSSGSCRKEEGGCSHGSKGVFGCWRKRAGGVSFSFRGGSCKSSVVRGGSFVISGEGGGGGGGGGVGGRKKRLLRWSPSKTHFWANIYGAFKQIIPKTSSTKWKKDDS